MYCRSITVNTTIRTIPPLCNNTVLISTPYLYIIVNVFCGPLGYIPYCFVRRINRKMYITPTQNLPSVHRLIVIRQIPTYPDKAVALFYDTQILCVRRSEVIGVYGT